MLLPERTGLSLSVQFLSTESFGSPPAPNWTFPHPFSASKRLSRQVGAGPFSRRSKPKSKGWGNLHTGGTVASRRRVKTVKASVSQSFSTPNNPGGTREVKGDLAEANTPEYARVFRGFWGRAGWCSALNVFSCARKTSAHPSKVPAERVPCIYIYTCL